MLLLRADFQHKDGKNGNTIVYISLLNDNRYRQDSTSKMDWTDFSPKRHLLVGVTDKRSNNNAVDEEVINI